MSLRDQGHSARRESAETLALQALAWIAAEQSRLAAFLADSGLSPGLLARRAGEAHFLAGVLDHLLADETRLRNCAADLGIPPGGFGPARTLLPGGTAPHWT